VNDAINNEVDAQIFAQQLHFFSESSDVVDFSEVIDWVDVMFLWQFIIVDESALFINNIIFSHEKFVATDCPTKQNSIINKIGMFLTDNVFIQ